jgi:hypothetical protein
LKGEIEKKNNFSKKGQEKKIEIKTMRTKLKNTIHKFELSDEIKNK